jgi:hypothetical protein
MNSHETSPNIPERIDMTFFVDEEAFPSPVHDGMINPIEVPCVTRRRIHAPAVTEVIDDGRGEKIAVVRCLDCGSLCDPAVAWTEYYRIKERL